MMKNHYLRDQALQIFLRHFFSIEWLREFVAETNLLNANANTKTNKNYSYSSLYFLTRLSIDFYPTCSILEKMMHIAEPHLLIGKLDKFYFFGAILELSKEYESDAKMVEVCSEVMKVPFEKLLSSKIIPRLLRDLKKLEPHHYLVEIVPSTMKELIQRMIDQKVKLEETRHLKDQFHYFKQLAQSFPQYYEEFSKVSPTNPSFQNSLDCLFPFAMKFIQENNRGDLIQETDNPKDIALLCEVLLYISLYFSGNSPLPS